MNIERVASGDIVNCLRRDRSFHAVVTGRDGSKLTFVPVTHNCPYYFASAREVLAHWAERLPRGGRLRTGAIRDGDIVAFGHGELTYARVLERDGPTLRVQELRKPSLPPHTLAATEVQRHFARRGRRRRTGA